MREREKERKRERERGRERENKFKTTLLAFHQLAFGHQSEKKKKTNQIKQCLNN